MKKFSEIKYERPDLQKVKDGMLAYMEAFKSAQTYGDARALFLAHEKELENIHAMYTVAYIRNTMDTEDKFYEGEMNFFYERMPELELVQREENELLLASPFKADFEREFGSDMIKSIEAGIRLADERIIPDDVEESKLCQEYSKTVAACKTEFDGEECNFYGLLKHMESPDRDVRKRAYVAWAQLYESVSDKLDGIFLRLVEIRKNKAKKLGFGSFTEMAYLANGHFYYGADDVAAFRKQVITAVVPAVKKLYDEQRMRLGVDRLHYYDEPLVFPDGNARPVGDMRDMVESARLMYREMSEETGEFFDFMIKYGLFDLETRNGKHMGGYCTFIDGYKAPFIFSNFNGTSADVDVLTHEAGHAFQAYTASKNVPLSSQIWSTSEVSEIHSMTMELFAYPWMEKFFGENADKYRYAHLSEAVKVIPYMCLVDHFQHEVYSHDFDAAGLRECWRRLERLYMPWRDYDGVAFLENGGFWMQKQHIFLFPFYYIDYALAQMCAFGYFTRAKTDRDGAWKDYLALCKAGGSKDYFSLLETGGLSSPFADGAVARAVAGVLKELEK